MNFFDTAMGYQGGTSEEYVGRAMRDFARRDEVVLATKFIPRTPAEQDAVIIRRVEELAQKRSVSMTEISLAWLMRKGAVPVAGATKLRHLDGAAAAAELALTAEETAYLEEPYVPHQLVGVMANNR